MPERPATLYRFDHETRLTELRGPAARASPGSTYEGVDAMGRGRQKAKQTKVARQLKYFSPDTDYTALERELAGSPQSGQTGLDAPDDPDDEADRWNTDDDEDDGWSATR